MPTPAMTRGEAQAALDALERAGGSVTSAAVAEGVARTTFSSRIRRARALIDMDPAIQASMASVGTNLVPRLAWAKVPAKDGEPGYSVLLKPEELPEDTLARIREAFEGMAPAAPVVAPERVVADLLTVYPVMDLHLGMHAWGRETGGPDYDLKTAASDIEYAFEKVLSLTPQSSEAVLILGGDTLHADDDNAQTPQSKHALDVDGRQFKVIEQAIRAIAYIAERLAQRHARVTIRVLRGNHDLHAHTALTFAMAERYRNDERISVEKDPRDMFMRQWGRSAIFANHGDRMKPQQMVNLLCDICPFWSATRHRYALTGHIHHDSSKDFGALRWESLRAFCPPDSYAASMGYPARRALQALTFDKTDGLVLRALDPIERAA